MIFTVSFARSSRMFRQHTKSNQPVTSEENDAMSVSFGEQAFIKDGVAEDMRNDGRSRAEYRGLVLETGLMPQCNGSARIKVLCSCFTTCDQAPDHA